jgi:uncharacterized protein
MTEITFEIPNNNGEVLRGKFIQPETSKTKFPLVIMLTGDGPKGSKSLSWVNIPPRLAKHGIASMLFDFSGLGNSDGARKELTLSKGIADFKIIFNQIEKHTWIDFDRLSIMGSSFGACVALMLPEILNKCKAIGFKSPSTFLPDAYFKELSLETYNNWIKSGYCEENGYNSKVLFDPFKYNVYAEIPKIKSKCLITHGDADEVVPYQQSLFLKDLLSGEVELITFENGDHGYSGENWEKMAFTFETFYKNELT